MDSPTFPLHTEFLLFHNNPGVVFGTLLDGKAVTFFMRLQALRNCDSWGEILAPLKSMV